jgi:hypothetical protein
LNATAWLEVNRGDIRAFGISRRHYSITNKRPKVRQFIQAGSPMVLLTPTCDALFVWVKNSVERKDKQEGVICTLFRNEGPTLSSRLIERADDLAWERWADRRHFTYVDADKVASSNPGYCFLMAGWQKCGFSQEGLLILEHVR